MVNPTLLYTLQAFRAAVYQHLGARGDALFDVLDAATTVGSVPSLPYLSLTAAHRRGWGSLYAALAEGGLDAPALRALVGRYPLDDGQPIYALDTSVWRRNDAETSPERGYYYSAARQSAGQPIVAGWSYAWLAQISFTHDSWTAPVDVRRVPLSRDAHAVAAEQILELVRHQPANAPTTGPRAARTPWPEVRLPRCDQLVGARGRAHRAARPIWRGAGACLGQ